MTRAINGAGAVRFGIVGSLSAINSPNASRENIATAVVDPMRYRVLDAKGNHYKVEYQENGGGTLTTASTIEFEIDKRNIRHNGSPMTVRVLRVLSYTQK